MKKKLLVFASTFPRWKDDTNPPFVYELSKRLTKDFDVYVLAPHYPEAKRYEVMDKMKVYRFRYFLEKYQKLAGSGGILPTLKKNKWFYLQVPFFLLGEYFALKRLVKEIKPDLVHAHWIIPQGFIAALVKKSTGIPYVVTSHGSDIMGLKGFNKIKKYVLKNAKDITVVSNAIKKEILDNIDSNLDIKVIPMGVDTDLFNLKKRDNSIKKKYSINGPFLLFVGRLAPEKGIKYLIEAMPEIIKNFPKAKLMVIGDGTMKDELQKRTNELDIKDKVIFMGWVNNKDLPKYYATADVFVCPSLREGSPVSYIEALACGTPIIVGDIPISREIVNENNGLIVKIESSEDIAKKVVNYFKGNSSKNKNIMSLVKNNYDENIVSKRFAGVLR